MGLTIHYGGGAAENREQIDNLINRLTKVAQLSNVEHWTTHEKTKDWRTGEMYNHKGICMNLDEGCETFEIAFNYDSLELKKCFCKTQYSQNFVKTHHTICLLLNMIQNEYVKDMEIHDEGEYFGNWNKEALVDELKEWNEMIKSVGDMLKNCFGDNPNIEVIEQPETKKEKYKFGLTCPSCDKEIGKKVVCPFCSFVHHVGRNDKLTEDGSEFIIN